MNLLPRNVLQLVREAELRSSKRIRTSDQPEQDDFDVLWSEVQAGISRALDLLAGKSKKRITSGEDVHLYDTIYRMCPLYSAQLYELYKLVLQSQTLMALQSLIEKHDEFLLMEFLVVWKNHQVMVKMLRKYFLVLNAYYITPNLLLPLKELGVSCFHDIVFEEPKTKLTTTIIGMVNNERDVAHIDRALVKEVLATYVQIGRQNLGLYVINFEQPFCKCTQIYYAKKAQTWMSEDSCAEYMLKVEESLQEEKERVAHYFHSSTEPKLLEVILSELWKHGEHILNRENSGCKELLLDGKHDDLSRIYWFFYMDGLSELLKIFKKHVKEEGISLIKHATANDKKDFIQKAIQLHDKLLSNVTHCFKNNPAYHKVLTNAFIELCNEDIAGSSCGELLAFFCDDILRNGGRDKLSDEAIEETLDKILFILECIRDKDIFLGVHRNRLARRLLSKSLLSKSCNDKYEQSLLSRLKRSLGDLSTKKMDEMFSDITTSEGYQANFEQHLCNHPEFQLNVDLSVTVLRSQLWPSYKTFDINLPSELAKCVEVFTNYYKSNHERQKLTWINGLGTCTIIVNFDSKPIELIVSTYQAALLLLFEQADRLSYSDIVTLVNMSDADVVRVLKSFSCAKHQILNKEPSNRKISQSDIFYFNSKFTSNMSTIKVPLPSVAIETGVDAVIQDRKFAIEACIMRVMKADKVMSHQQLVGECTKKLSRKFQPQVSDIKKSIDNLITRGYIERDPDTSFAYRYLPC